MDPKEMELAVSEMDEETSKLSFKENAVSDNLNQVDSNAKRHISLAEGIDPLAQDKVQMHKETILVQRKAKQDTLTRSKTDSVLLRGSDEEECCQLIKENSINTFVKSSTSLSNIADKYLTFKTFIDRSLPEDKCLKKSSSYNDITLPSSKLSTSLSHTYSDIIPNYKEHRTSNKSPEVNVTCNDEEEIVFNNKFCIDIHDAKLLPDPVVMERYEKHETRNNIESFENVSQLDNISGNIVVTNNPTDDRTDFLKPIGVLNGGRKPSNAIHDTKLQSNIISRPTLADDSRLVKISLPTNPINIMQSNAQFLNKSRNFLNFITEKSTNIMEKALLPQHLQMRYNCVLKSIDNNYNERKLVEESSNAAFGLAESGFKSQPVLTTNDKTITNLKIDSIDIRINEKKLLKNYECRNTITKSSNENAQTSIETSGENVLKNDCILDKNNDGITTLKFQQSDCSNVNNEIEKIKDNVSSMETNGNYDGNKTAVFSTKGNITKESILSNIYQSVEEYTDSEESKRDLLHHPAHRAIVRNYVDLKSQHLSLKEKVEHLEERNRMLEAENRGEIFSAQIETLEKMINRLTSEIRTSLEAQEILKREYNAANKERENMVMKYAVSEKQLIDTQRAKEFAERRVKEMSAQQESLQSKLREMQGERARICNILSGKHRDVTDLQREVEKLREDVKMRDIKLQWTQNKLKTEMDLQKETQQKLDKATTRINEMKEECEQVRKETQETMRKFQQSEENKAVTLDQQLKEQQARLILERHVTEDKEMLRLQLQKEVDTLKHRQQVLIEENNTLSLKIQEAQKNRVDLENNLSNLKSIADQRQVDISELLCKVSELEALKTQLQQKEHYLASTETEIQHLRLTNEELQSDMLACRKKEAEMLDFTQKLTDKNVRLQSEFTAIEGKAKQLEQQHGPLHERIKELTEKIESLEKNLAEERRARIHECETLTKHLAEQTQLAQKLTQQLEDSQGENAVLKRKQQISTKEMMRELQQCRKKLEVFEASSPYNSLAVASRTGSTASLNTGDHLNSALSDNSINGEQSSHPAEPSKQMLIDRIIKLQESNARKAEKIDFFEEHTRILVEELQKKKKIIQTYILHENIGAMGGNERDKYKHIKSRRNAAELARHGGIMASVYNQRVSDDNMTLELSLQINQKLQTVLEDALFKNITLKDNIDTLGEEIARLTMQNQKRQKTN